MRALALISMFVVYVPIGAWQPFCGVLLWTWFSIMNPHRIVYGFGVELPYAMVIAVVSLGGWILSKEPKLPPRNAIAIALMAMMIVVSISSFFALAPGIAYSQWDRVFKTLLMTVFALTLMTNRVRIHAFIWVLVLSIGFFGIKGGAFAISTGGAYRVFGPPYTYITDNNHLAAALVMTIPLMQYLQQESKLILVRLGLLVMQILSFAAAVFSYSRGSFLGLLAMGAVLLLRSRRKLLLSLLAVGCGGVVLMAAPDQWFHRMETIQRYDEDDSALSRLEIWRAGLAIVRQRPVFGGGFRATYSQAVVDRYAPGTEARAVHNSHLEVLIENGAVGFLLHLVMLIGSFVYGSRIRKMTRRNPDLQWAHNLASMLQVSLVGYTVAGTFLSLGYYDGWYNLAAAMAALHVIVSRETQQQTATDARATPSQLQASRHPVRPSPAVARQAVARPPGAGVGALR